MRGKVQLLISQEAIVNDIQRDITTIITSIEVLFPSIEAILSLSTDAFDKFHSFIRRHQLSVILTNDTRRLLFQRDLVSRVVNNMRLLDQAPHKSHIYHSLTGLFHQLLSLLNDSLVNTAQWLAIYNQLIGYISGYYISHIIDELPLSSLGDCGGDGLLTWQGIPKPMYYFVEYLTHLTQSIIHYDEHTLIEKNERDDYPEDVRLAQITNQMKNMFASDVQVRGSYPGYTKRYFNDYHILINEEPDDADILCKGTVDFYSCNYYMSNCVSQDSSVTKTAANLVSSVKNPYLSTSKWGWQIDPLGLRTYLNDIYDRYQLPIMIVENGLGAADKLDGTAIHDDYRIDYLKEHISAMKDVVAVIGYCSWSSLDLIAFSTGNIEKRYGFIYVDADNLGNGSYQRYPKDSYYWYQNLISHERGQI